MRLLELTTALLVVSSAAACLTDTGEGRPDDEAEDWRSGGKADGESCDFDAMSAASYYGQFAYEEITSETTNHTWYRVGLTWDVVAVLDDGNKVDLNVYFLPEGRVIAEYAEEKYVGGGQSEVLNETVIVTRARIDEATRAITIDGLGAGTPMTVTSSRGECQPAIDFEFSSDLRSPGLAGDGSLIQAGMSSAYVIDPDHLDEVPNETARRYFEEDVASGKIKIVRF